MKTNLWLPGVRGGRDKFGRLGLSYTHCHSVLSDSLWPYGLQLAKLFCPWDSPGKNMEVGSHSLSRGSSWSRDWIESSALQVDYLPAKPPEKLHIYTAAAKSLQSCPTLCDPRDGSPPGSPVPGILQARTLEWIAISFSNAWKWKVKVKSLSHVRLLATS